MVSSMRGLATAEVVDRIGQYLSVESQGAWRQTSALHGKVMKAFPAKAFGDLDSFRMAIAKGVFPRGWKDIPEDKRNLPFVFRIALEEGLLNGLGSLELGKARQMAADEDAELFGTAIEKGLFPGGWKDIPKKKRKRPFVLRVAQEKRLRGTPKKQLSIACRSKARIYLRLGAP